MLVIAVHYPQRELVAKILLAHKAAHRYGKSAIGRSGVIRRSQGQIFRQSFGPLNFGKKIKNGVVFEVALTPEASIKTRIPAIIQEGFGVVSFDEEATSFWDPIAFAKRRVDDKSASMIDVLYSWGKWHNIAIQNSALDLKKVSGVGHPRFEVYQDKYNALYRDQIDYINSKYDRFVLINTNITEVDWSEEAFLQRIKELEFKRKKVARDIDGGFGDIGLMKLKSEARKRAFIDQVTISQIFKKIAIERGAGDIKVVMRPKPSVVPAKLEAYAKDLGFQGLVDGRFSIVPWLKSCSAVLHHGCTTGIEAALAGKPAVMCGNEEFVATPVKEASFLASGLQEAADMLYSTSVDGVEINRLAEKYKAVEFWHHNVAGSPSDAILDDLERRGLVTQEVSFNAPKMMGCRNNRGTFTPSVDDNYHPGMRGIDAPINFNEVKFLIAKLDRVFGVETSCVEVRKEIFYLSRT